MDFLQVIREYELKIILSQLPQNGKILDVGAGAGYHAKVMSEKGHDVEAIDVETSIYHSRQVYPVKQYDGKTIPFPDHHFDGILCSLVLEVIPQLDSFLKEVVRVAKPNGVTIVIVCTASWRWWTGFAHYVYIPKLILKKIFGIEKPKEKTAESHESTSSSNLPTQKRNYAHILFPHPVGPSQNVFSEFWKFTDHQWQALFRKAGWVVAKKYGNGLFYTGYNVMGYRLGFRFRQILSTLLGSSSRVYILRKKA